MGLRSGLADDLPANCRPERPLYSVTCRTNLGKLYDGLGLFSASLQGAWNGVPGRGCLKGPWILPFRLPVRRAMKREVGR